jgi:hypothetical protein
MKEEARMPVGDSMDSDEGAARPDLDPVQGGRS